jgi:hypothetical protein
MTDAPTEPHRHPIPPPGSPTRQDTRIMTHFEPDPDPGPVPVAYADPKPGLVELTPAGISPLAEAEDREQRRWNQARAVRLICTIITIITSVFAVVLAANVIMVLGEANPANGFASFVRGFASAVSLGFDTLFTPANAKTQVLLNDGLAALVWLGLGAVVTMLIRRFALPGPRRPLRYVARPRRGYVDPTAPR